MKISMQFSKNIYIIISGLWRVFKLSCLNDKGLLYTVNLNNLLKVLVVNDYCCRLLGFISFQIKNHVVRSTVYYRKKLLVLLLEMITSLIFVVKNRFQKRSLAFSNL